jgi:spermidine synthase
VFRFLFPFNLFLGAFLLFSMQPMAAKTLLPIYGGTPTTWAVCMLFFQGILLLAYGYVTLFPLLNKAIWWRIVHAVLIGLSLMVMPLFLQPEFLVNKPELNIICNLLIQLGLPLLVVGSSAPLLQFLYSQTSNKGASDPYFLYSASNLGSLIALLIYPWLIEHFIGLTNQFLLWNILYLIYLAGLLILFFLIPFKPLKKLEKHQKDWSWTTILTWLFLSFVPCSLMLSVTVFITTDVAATPLFWVLPLILYLLTFILTFTKKPFFSSFRIKSNVLFWLVFVILGFFLGAHLLKAWQLILFNLASFFSISLMCHAKLYEKRPPPQELTLFYFILAIGGVLAGIVNGLLAPNLLNQVYEYPIAIFLSLFVLSDIKKRSGAWIFPFVFLLFALTYCATLFKLYNLSSYQLAASFIATAFIFIRYKNKCDFILSMGLLLSFIFFIIQAEGNNLLQERNFYGVKRVIEKERMHVLINQSTAHGLQNMDDTKSFNGISSYYGGIKSALSLIKKSNSSLKVTLVGLGAGTLLCQFRSTDTVNAIEIDPQVVELAKNNSLFTYIRDCLPEKNILTQDGRIAISELPNLSQNLIILDAFSSDAIPVHLITLEAVTLYKQKLTRDGAIFINLSNRHLDLLPVINAISRSLGMMTFYINHHGNLKEQQFNSQWVLLTTNESLSYSLNKFGWHFLSNNKQLLWTDDYANIIPILRW